MTIPDSDAPVTVMFLGKANTHGDAVIWVESERFICTGDIEFESLPQAAASFPTYCARMLNKIEGFDFAYLVPGHGHVQRDHAYLEKVNGALFEMQRQVVRFAKN